MAREKRLAPRIIGWLVFFCVVAAPVVFFLLYEEEIEVTVTTVSRGHVEKTISSISAGTVTAKQDSMTAAAFIGTVAAVPAEGQRFEKGDVLVELNHDDLDAQVALAEGNLKVGLSRLKQAKMAAKIYEEITATRVSLTSAHLDLARAEFARIKALSDRKAISESDLDKAATALRVAEETSVAAKASQKENQIRAEEILSVEATIDQIKAGIEVAKATRERAFVRAPFQGIVAKRLMDVGEATAMGIPLLQFVQDSECYVLAPFDEANVAEVRVGQKARLNIDAYRNEDFTGEVTYISPVILSPQISLANPAAGAAAGFDLSRKLEVKIRIDGGEDKFMPGMSVDVTIIADEKNDAPYVPSEALVREEFAYVVQDGRAIRRTVKTGVGNWRTVEIIEGLREGDTVITSLSLKALRDGVKVRVVDELEE